MKSTLNIRLNPEETAHLEQSIEEIVQMIETVNTRLGLHQAELGRLKQERKSKGRELNPAH